ncbi:MAG: PIN domain-containing protein [Acidimicrobiales bacterium]
MLTGADDPDVLVDTSVAIALVVADHDGHGTTAGSLAGRRLGLAGHAAFETFSVLTRLPSPLRRTPRAARQILSANFPGSRFLGATAAAQLLERLEPMGIAGGAVYDALVGATAAEHRLPLATRDRRAREVYRAFDLEVELLA